MKHFIYMDTNIVNSYISQFNDGLKVRSNEEVTDCTATTQLESGTDNKTTTGLELNLGILKGKTNFNNNTLTESTTLATSQTGRELIEKIAHDNAFNNFVNLVKQNEGIKTDDISINDYISLEGTYTIYDLDHLIEFFSEDTLDVITDLELKDLEAVNKMSDSIKKNKKREIIQNNKYTLKMLNLAKKSLPYSKFMIIDKNFIILKDEYLRESPNSIRFTYSSKVKLLGKYTNNYTQINTRNRKTSIDEVFNSLDDVISAFLNDLLGIDSTTKIILPIALYFE